MAFSLPALMLSTRPRRGALRRLIVACLGGAGLLCGVRVLLAQETTATLHGVVMDRATGQPIARVMVYPSAGGQAVLTDSAGQFAFPDVPLGSVQLHYRRPGYLDPLSGQEQASRQVMLTADAPEQVLPLDAAASLHGQIVLGEGDSAAGIRLELYEAHVQDGRRRWEVAQTVRARGDGSFSFAELQAGSYVVHAEASEDPVPADMPAGMRAGYAPVFAPDAEDIASATVYALRPGQADDVRLRMTRVPFYPVSVRVGGSGGMGSFQITGNGFTNWTPRYSREDDALTTELPSGNYVLHASGGGRQASQGELALHVDGAPVSGVSVTLDAAAGIAVVSDAVANSDDSAGTASGAQARLNLLTFLPAGDSVQPALTESVSYTGSDGAGVLDRGVRPGRYWVSGVASGGYVAALTSNGTNLFSEPLTVVAGAAPALEAAIRQDGGAVSVVRSGGPAEQPCVLQLIPLAPGGPARTTTVQPADATASFTNVPPGDYLVLATEERAGIAFREPGVLAQLTGTRVTVTPGGTAQATVSAFFEPPAGTTGAP